MPTLLIAFAFDVAKLDPVAFEELDGKLFPFPNLDFVPFPSLDAGLIACESVVGLAGGAAIDRAVLAAVMLPVKRVLTVRGVDHQTLAIDGLADPFCAVREL